LVAAPSLCVSGFAVCGFWLRPCRAAVKPLIFACLAHSGVVLKTAVQLSSTQIDTDPALALPISAENSNPRNTKKESYVKKIYVGNFSFNMTEPELRALFEPFGAIESASVATDRDTGRSRGFGFVSMPNDDEAEKAMAALNGKETGGRALTVNEARPQVQRGGFGGGGGGRGGDRGGGGGSDRGGPRQRREPRW